MAKREVHRKKESGGWPLPVILVIGFAAYIPAISNGFVNWDDIAYVYNNELITTFSWQNLREIFSSYFMGNYHPLAMLSLSFDYHLFELSPKGYHLHSILLHLVNTILIYVLMKRLFPGVNFLAAFAALVFVLHPMHVESVAWVSGRKDLLYTAWYLLALISYLSFLENRARKHYLLCLLFFFASLLSKGQAVTLPVVLFLVDYLRERRIDLKLVVEKVPFLLLSLIFGLVAIHAQGDSSYINPLNMPFWQSLLYAPYGFGVYLVKFIFPVFLTSLYEYPLTRGGFLPWYVIASPVLLVVYIYILVRFRNSEKMSVFGLALFLVTILPVLQFLPVGKAVLAERYTYLPYLGLSIVIFNLVYIKGRKLTRQRANLLAASLLLFLAVLFLLSWQRTKVWKDSYTLWSDVIAKNPGSVTAYMNRAFLYNQERKYKEAINECDLALGFDSLNPEVYKNRGIANSNLGNHRDALRDYSMAITYDPEDIDLRLYRGIIYTDKIRQYDSGIADFLVFKKANPDSENVTFNLMVAYYNKECYDSAKHYCAEVIRINPQNTQAINLLTRLDSLIYAKKIR